MTPHNPGPDAFPASEAALPGPQPASPTRRQALLGACACTIGLGTPSLGAAAAGWPLDLSAFQRSDGALCMMPGSDWVDPYFALKALVLASTFGAQLGNSWPRFARYITTIQDGAGLIPRELGQASTAPAAKSQGLLRKQRSAVSTQTRSQADADDALLALWLQAGSLLPSPAGLPASTMQESQLRAAAMLQGPLWNQTLGLTRVFQQQETYLLIDNLEVWNAVQQLARSSPWVGLTALRRRLPSAQEWSRLESRLRQGIQQQFPGLQTLNPAWCAPAAPWELRLYPDGTAAPLLWMAQRGISPAASSTPSARLAAWYSVYRDVWQASIQNEYPWGLLALSAYLEGQRSIAASWVKQAATAKAQGRWHIMEEVLLQVLGQLLSRNPPSSEAPPGSGGPDDTEELPLTIFGSTAHATE